MEELISTFHIDWGLMVAQIVNFGLVFLALYFIAAKPLSKLIKERTEEITGGLENAKKAEANLASAELKKKEIIHAARGEAKVFLDKSSLEGKDIIKEAKQKAEIEKEGIIKQAHLDAEKSKKVAEEALRKEASDLVESGVKKVVESYVSAGHGDDIIKGMLAKK